MYLSTSGTFYYIYKITFADQKKKKRRKSHGGRGCKKWREQRVKEGSENSIVNGRWWMRVGQSGWVIFRPHGVADSDSADYDSGCGG